MNSTETANIPCTTLSIRLVINTVLSCYFVRIAITETNVTLFLVVRECQRVAITTGILSKTGHCNLERYVWKFACATGQTVCISVKEEYIDCSELLRMIKLDSTSLLFLKDLIKHFIGGPYTNNNIIILVNMDTV